MYMGAAAGDVELPVSVMLSAELAKRDEIATDSGGLTDIWRGTYRGTRVAIKAFRTYPARNLEEAKEVCIGYTPRWEISSKLVFTDFVEIGAKMEKA
jgi:hypothetical protein